MSIRKDSILDHSVDAVFIIGNGFDLDIGLPTSYAKFATSDFWPFKTPVELPNSFRDGYNHRSLHNVLHKVALESNWFDIEQILTDYATLDGVYDPKKHVVTYKEMEDAQKDKIAFNNLCDSLINYLKAIQSNELKSSSVAARVLQAVINSRYFTRIFSFNYTDLKAIAKSIGIDREFWYSHMHGDLKSGIILGIESQTEFLPPYRFLCKEYNMKYGTRFLNYCVQEAKEIVIFGHSLSPVDYHYFQQLFSQQSREDMKYTDKKTITIFTKDEETKQDICDQLRNMNNKRLDLLFGMNVFHILRTDGSDEEEITGFLKRLEIISKDYKRLHGIKD